MTMKMTRLYPFILLIMLCAPALTLQSCRQKEEKKELTEQEKERLRLRKAAGERLGEMLNARELDHALLYIDTLNRQFPNDPQFSFGEGWVHEMRGDSVRARRAYTRSLEIYDSLIAVRHDVGDMVNRAFLVQILYGMEAYDRALDEILPYCSDERDSMGIEYSKGIEFKTGELSF